MLGWSIHIKRNGETVLFAESIDIELDRKIRENADEILDAADYEGWGYGYPNRYYIRNNRLPKAKVYRYTNYAKDHDAHYRVLREDSILGPFSDCSPDEILWIELWDQS